MSLFNPAVIPSESFRWRPGPWKDWPFIFKTHRHMNVNHYSSSLNYSPPHQCWNVVVCKRHSAFLIFAYICFHRINPIKEPTSLFIRCEKQYILHHVYVELSICNTYYKSKQDRLSNRNIFLRLLSLFITFNVLSCRGRPCPEKTAQCWLHSSIREAWLP